MNRLSTPLEVAGKASVSCYWNPSLIISNKLRKNAGIEEPVLWGSFPHKNPLQIVDKFKVA